MVADLLHYAPELRLQALALRTAERNDGRVVAGFPFSDECSIQGPVGEEH